MLISYNFNPTPICVGQLPQIRNITSGIYPKRIVVLVLAFEIKWKNNFLCMKCDINFICQPLGGNNYSADSGLMWDGDLWGNCGILHGKNR